MLPLKNNPVVIPKRFTFRVVKNFYTAVVPPRLTLALAMTEKDEKAQRARIMQAQGYSELDAARAVANKAGADDKASKIY